MVDFSEAARAALADRYKLDSEVGRGGKMRSIKIAAKLYWGLTKTVKVITAMYEDINKEYGTNIPALH